MGNALTGGLQELHLQDLAAGIVQDRTLGGGRLLKSVQCWTEDGMPVVVKVYLKKEDDPPLALGTYHEKLKLLAEKLSLKNQPNVLSYHRMVETDRAGYLVRQYCYSNLADRISTRPFFSGLGKKWIAYQILQGLNQLKQAGLSHGDIKAENIVLTGWDWAFLTDLAPFKPVTLPADDPSNFAYFFDTAERRICLIAPERFQSSNSTTNQQTHVTEQMDIFSVGCVLAQLYLEGEALFDLSQLLAYRKGDVEHLNTFLNRIDDTNMRELITHMLQLDPEKRYSVKEYLEKWTPSIFPTYFEMIHSLLSMLVAKSCDERIVIISKEYSNLISVLREVNSSAKIDSECAEGTEIIATILCSSVRNARSVSLRVKGLALMQQLAEYASNYTRLQRLVPYACFMLNDSSPLVKTTAIRTLTYVLSKITKFPTSETNLFNDYILPALRTLATDTSEMVRVTFAEYLPLLGYEARRFLEMGEVIKQNSLRNANIHQDDISSPLLKGTYDSDLNNLHDEIGSLVLQLSMDECSVVKIALLKNILQLCAFYGRRKANESVLPTIITFLNGREWRLREAFFEQIVGISVFVGATSLRDFILPLVLQALNDSEELVIERAMSGLVTLCELAMFDKRTIVATAKKISPLLHHPNSWIRYDAIAFFASASKQLGLADTNCFLVDILQPHLDRSIFSVSENTLLESVKPPIPRHLYDKVLSSPLENLQIAASSDANAVIRWKKALSVIEISVEDAEKLDLMKPYIDQTAKSMLSRLWDNNDAADVSSDPIKLTVPLQSYFIPIESPFVPLQPTNLSTQNLKTKDQKPFNNDWNAFFNKPTPRKLVNVKGTASNSQTSSSPSPSQTTTATITEKELNSYRPTGQICAQSHEHKGSINEIAVHDSLTWFVTGGNDGTVRLWDLRQQERDYSMVSKLTCNLAPNSGKVMSVAVLPMSSPLIAASTDHGWLQFFSADLGTTVYQVLITDQGAQFMQSYDTTNRITQNQYPAINVIRPFMISSTPLLMVGNQSGSVIGIDPRVKREAFLWKSKDSVQQGPITAICGEESWMVTGTRRGFLSLWDLRFQIGVSTSRISHTPIYRMGICTEPQRSHVESSHGSVSPSIYVAAGTRDIKLWDLESRSVSTVYRCYDKRASSYQKSRGKSSKSPSSSGNSSDGSSTPPTDLSSTSTRARRLSGTTAKDPFAVKELERINWEDNQSSPFEVRALYVNPDGNFISGSSDCRVRFWDVDQVDQSYVVSGLESSETSAYTVQTDTPTTTTISTNTGSGSAPPVTVNTCTFVSEVIKDIGQHQTRRGGSFSAPISTRHLDTVTDIKVVGTHTPMLLSASRDGVVKMWQ